MLERLEKFAEGAAQGRGGDELLHDIVIGEEGPDHPVQFRATWNEATGSTTMLVGIRNLPVPPAHSDPLTYLRARHGAHQVVVLELDEDGAVAWTSGDAVLPGGVRASDFLGMTTPAMMARLTEPFGQIEISPGPSLYTSDVVLHPRGTGPEHAVLRAMTDQRDGRSMVWVAVLNPGTPADPTASVEEPCSD